MARRKTMSEEFEILKRLQSGQSIKSVQRETGLHKKTIRKIRNQSIAAGIFDKNNLSEAEFQKVWVTQTEPAKEHPLDNFKQELSEWVEKNYTYVVMHRLIGDRHICDESTLRRYVQKNFPVKLKPVIRRPTIPGEVMEVDFGYLGIFYDEIKKRNRKVWVFSARLRHSRKTYRQTCYGQDVETFIDCHIRAFEHFGGVPQKVVPDNLKAAVIKACFHEPLLNRSYRSLAEHYGFFISPCLPYTPRHKGGVENDIKYVKRNFLPVFRETQKRLGREIPCTADLRQALADWDKNTADIRIIQGVGKSPAELFETEEKAMLKPLPQFRWEPVDFKMCKVAPDFRIQYNKAYYSVPYEHIGKEVLVRADYHSVRIFLENRLICEHARAVKSWQFMFKEQHAPVNPMKYLKISRQGLLQEAESLGPSVHALLLKIFEDRVYDGLRPARGILSFARKYSPERLRNACRRALDHHTASYMSVKNILAQGLDKQSAEAEEYASQNFRFARPPGYFDF